MAFNSFRVPLPLLLALGVVLVSSLLLGGCRSYPNCKNDSHCENYDRGTPFCVDNICRQCADDGHCGAGFRCQNGVCTAIPGYCESDADCPSPGVCRDNRCGPQCLSDADCGEGQECSNGRCVTAPECRADGDCGEGMECRNGRCVQAAPTGPCADRRMRTIYFAFDESSLTQQSRADLQYNVTCLEVHGGNIVVEGHCDERGTAEYNMALGERRARAARDFLLNNGVERSRIRTVSYGFNRPADPRSNEAAWARNRRAEFVWE